jgi:hypothetical protein
MESPGSEVRKLNYEKDTRKKNEISTKNVQENYTRGYATLIFFIPILNYKQFVAG